MCVAEVLGGSLLFTRVAFEARCAAAGFWCLRGGGEERGEYSVHLGDVSLQGAQAQALQLHCTHYLPLSVSLSLNYTTGDDPLVLMAAGSRTKTLGLDLQPRLFG